MALELDFVISDESINRYGFRILTSGIRLTAFEQNPVCCVGHNVEKPSIGKWKNLRKEADGRLLGTLEFDEDDAEAVRLYNKYKNGYMKAVSLSVHKIAESVAPEHLLPGQKFPTVSESDMLEVSLCTLPGNGNAVKLVNDEGVEVRLSFINNPLNNSNMPKTVEELQQEIDQLRQQRAASMVALHVTRGAIPNTEQAFWEKAAMNDFDGVSTHLSIRPGTSTETANPAAEQLADTLVDLHFDRGAISAEEKPFYRKSAIQDYDGTKAVLSARPGKESIDAFVGGMGKPATEIPAGEDRAKWTYLDYYKNDQAALSMMQTSDPEKYGRILTAHRLSMSQSGKYIMDDEKI